jgi:hypothetical protein
MLYQRCVNVQNNEASAIINVKQRGLPYQQRATTMRQYSPNEVSLAIVNPTQRGMPYQRCTNIHIMIAEVSLAIIIKQRGTLY